MKNRNFTGIVLRKRIFCESDLIISVLSESGIRHEILVKGANGRSKRKSHIESMNFVKGSFYEGRNNKYLKEINCLKSYFKLKENLEISLRIYLILEIIEKSVLEDDPHKETFALLKETLENCDKKEASRIIPEISLTKLAWQLGLLPNFKECSSCHEKISGEKAGWNPANNTLLCKKCLSINDRRLPLKYRKALEFFKTAEGKDYEKVKIDEEEYKVIREFLPNLFTKQMDKPLNTLGISV